MADLDALARALQEAISAIRDSSGTSATTGTTRTGARTAADFTAKETEYRTEITQLKELAKLKGVNTDADLEILRIEKKLLDLQKERQEVEGTYDVEARKNRARAIKDLQAQEAGLNAGADAARRLLGVSGQQNSMLAQLAAGGTKFGSMLLKGFGNAVNAANALTSGIDKVVEATMALAIAQDQVNVQFAKNTGQGNAFLNTVNDLEATLFTAGVTADEASQAVQGLFQNVSGFTAMSKSQQAELGKTVAVLQELGVSAQNSTKNIQISTKVLGMSTTQAGKLQRELFVFAQGLGVSVDQMSSDFGAMGPKLAALGTNGVAAFKKLQIQAKNTGLQVSELLSMTEKFDKFDTAAQSVGKLNALLGGPYLNSLELLTETDPSKRMEIMKKRIDAAGLSFDRMSYYQRKAMASAMGLNEQQLALFMRGSLDKIMPKPKSGAELEALAKQTAQFNTVAEEMAQIGRMFAISFGPAVSMFKDFIQKIQPAIPLVIGLGIAIAGVLTPFGWISSAIGIVVGGLVILSNYFGSLYNFLIVGNSPSFVEAMEMVGTAITSLFNPFTMLSNLVAPAANFFSNMATGATNLAESIMGIPDSKAATFTSTVKQTSEAITSMPQQANGAIQGINSAAATSVASNTSVPQQAAPPTQADFSGPAPTINLSLSIAGEEIAAVVNNVEVSKTATNNTLYDSIIGMIEQGLIKG